MGFAIPVGFSILSDIVPADERSGMFGLLTIFSAVSNGVGQGLSAFLGPMNILNFGWRFPFFILSILAIIGMIALRYVKLPEMGSTEESLAELRKLENSEYSYTIDKSELVQSDASRHLPRFGVR